MAGEASSAGLRGEEGPTDGRESFGRGRLNLGERVMGSPLRNQGQGGARGRGVRVGRS